MGFHRGCLIVASGLIVLLAGCTSGNGASAPTAATASPGAAVVTPPDPTAGLVRRQTTEDSPGAGTFNSGSSSVPANAPAPMNAPAAADAAGSANVPAPMTAPGPGDAPGLGPGSAGVPEWDPKAVQAENNSRLQDQHPQDQHPQDQHPQDQHHQDQRPQPAAPANHKNPAPTQRCQQDPLLTGCESIPGLARHSLR